MRLHFGAKCGPTPEPPPPPPSRGEVAAPSPFASAVVASAADSPFAERAKKRRLVSRSMCSRMSMASLGGSVDTQRRVEVQERAREHDERRELRRGNAH